MQEKLEHLIAVQRISCIKTDCSTFLKMFWQI